MGFIEKQENWNLSTNVANFQMGTSEKKFAINGDGSCLRLSSVSNQQKKRILRKSAYGAVISILKKMKDLGLFIH